MMLGSFCKTQPWIGGTRNLALPHCCHCRAPSHARKGSLSLSLHCLPSKRHLCSTQQESCSTNALHILVVPPQMCNLVYTLPLNLPLRHLCHCFKSRQN